MLFKKNRMLLRIVLSIVLVTAIALGVALIIQPKVSAAKFSSNNPKFIFTNIDGNLDDSGKFTPNGTGYQYGDGTGVITEEGKYRIISDAYTVWWRSDDVTFGYEKYALGTTNDDTLTIETEITAREVYSDDKSLALHDTASGGLMMRDSLEATSANVFLHARGDEVMVVYRTEGSKSTNALYTGIEPNYPIGLRLVRTGKTVTSYIRNGADANWVKLKAVGMVTDNDIYCGIAAHSSVPDIPILCNFTGYSADGSSTVEATDIDQEVETFVPPEDAPLKDNTLLRETFSDNSLTEGDASVSNPVWDNPTSTNIIEMTDENGVRNMVLNKKFEEGTDLITYKNTKGEEEWTDYTASFKFQYTENFDPELTNISRFIARAKIQKNNGYYGYGVQVRNGNVLQFIRYSRARYETVNQTGRSEIIYTYELEQSLYGDGKFHELFFTCFDNRITVDFDGTRVFDYTDNETLPNNIGGIAINTEYSDVLIDDIEVIALEDQLGGEYDNYSCGIGLDENGNPDYNQPIPDYLTSWQENRKQYLY